MARNSKRKFRTATAEELSQPNPEYWEIQSTREWLVHIPGLGQSKINNIATHAPLLKDLVQAESRNELKEFVGRVVIERIRGQLEIISRGKFQSITAKSKRNTKLEFLNEEVVSWLSGFCEGRFNVKRDVPLKFGKLGIELDLLITQSDGTKLAIAARRSIGRNTLVDAVGVLLMAQKLKVADRYLIVTTRDKSYCDELAGGIELHFVD